MSQWWSRKGWWENEKEFNSGYVLRSVRWDWIKVEKKDRSGMSPSLCNFSQFTQSDLVILFLHTTAHKVPSWYLYHSTYPVVIISNYIPSFTYKFLLKGRYCHIFMPLFPIPIKLLTYQNLSEQTSQWVLVGAKPLVLGTFCGWHNSSQLAYQKHYPVKPLFLLSSNSDYTAFLSIHIYDRICMLLSMWLQNRKTIFILSCLYLSLQTLLLIWKCILNIKQ